MTIGKSPHLWQATNGLAHGRGAVADVIDLLVNITYLIGHGIWTNENGEEYSPP
jgi:hypothetical protein